MLTIGLFFLLALTGHAADKTPPIPGQKPLLVIGDSFRFVEGSWAKYRILDKTKNETYLMELSILGQEQKKVRKKLTTFRWMEVRVEMPKNPVVVTRFLADETPQGPGELQDVIVQVEGYSPFSVPKKFYKENKKGNPGVMQVKPVQGVKNVEKRIVEHKGERIEVIDVEAVDADGRPLRASVSEALPPIGLFSAETADIKMDLEDQGLNAKSRITGTPMNFYLWVISQVADGLSEGEKK
jgi:hypothetical protein